MLTAANCIVGDNGRVEFHSGDVLAALGWIQTADFKRDITKDFMAYSAFGTQIIPISEFIPHPDYTGVYHASKEGS